MATVEVENGSDRLDVIAAPRDVLAPLRRYLWTVSSAPTPTLCRLMADLWWALIISVAVLFGWKVEPWVKRRGRTPSEFELWRQGEIRADAEFPEGRIHTTDCRAAWAAGRYCSHRNPS